MKRRYKHITMALLFVTALLLNVCPGNLSFAHIDTETGLPTRDEIIWGAGYWPGLGNFNPVRMDEGMGWDTYVAYEPVFGTDVAGGQVLGWLAEKAPEWDDAGTVLTVKLRSGAYWVKVEDWNGWVAGTYSPEYYRDINATDVVFTWYLTGACPESPTPAGFMTGIRTRVDDTYSTTIKDIKMSGFEIVDPLTIKLHIKSDYAFSPIVYRVLTRGYLVVPYDIWLQIDPDPAVPNAEGTYEYWGFTNIWTSDDYPVLRVASGMYLPWKHIQAAADRWQTITKKNINWWGAKPAGFGREPAPDFMGYYVGYPNEEIEIMIKEGLIDWDGSYVPGRETWPEFLKTYFEDAPYFPDKSALLMVPNYRKWPISASWLHWAIAYVIDYTAASAASSGYCVDGSKYSMYGTEIQYPNAFLIPKDDAIANTYLKNYPRKDNYLVGDKFHTVDEAIALLNQHCIKVGDVWYTKGTDINAIKSWIENMYNYLQTHGECGWFNNDPPMWIGTVKKKASEWLADFNTLVREADELPDVEGINVKLGPWTLIDIQGWTDVCAIDAAVAATVTSKLGIEITPEYITWDEYQAWTTGRMQTYEYDFADYCMQWGINGDLYERYAQLFTCWSGVWNHYNGWYNEELINLINQLDTAEAQEIANQIFDIVGEELPYIPLSGHPDWYIYSTKYWARWPNEKHAFLAASPYGGASQGFNLHFILLSLGSVNMPEDVNNDHTVSIKDIFAAARAFGSKPGHLRWDFAADINSDGEVNIRDMYLMAKAFGKTW